MSPAISLFNAFMRDLERFTITATSEGIVLKNGHVGRAFNLSHHDRQKLVNATRMLADAVEAWAKVPPVIEEAKPAPVVKEGMYGTIHEPPADIVMGAATPKQAEKPDLIQHGVAVEVKAKRPYKKRSKDV